MDELDPRTRSWAESVLGDRIRAVRPLSGGWTSRMLLVTSETGTRAVLRSMTREPWRTHAAQLLAREASVHGQLAGTVIPAPVTLAVDPTGDQAGIPSLLMTLLPGCLELERADPGLLAALARMLADIHAFRPETRPRDYQSWAQESKRVVPAWAGRPDLWRRAFATLAAGPPPYDAVFLHRDFHLGNVLWTGQGPDREISGVVDWVETSWGPARLDVAHCRTNLAMLHGPESARSFAAAYDALAGADADAGRGADADADAGHHAGAGAATYWDVLDIVGYLPDPAKVIQPWRDHGRRITDRIAHRRLEEHLASVLETS